jgi:UDP-GlcNAc:undecaprenyl-phosphate GlcNAc-1-phosphate transferase
MGWSFGWPVTHPISLAGIGAHFLVAAGIVIVTGILDDLFALRPRWKLLGQTCAAGVLVAGGLVIKRLCIFGYTANLEWLGLGLTLVWLVGAMNAMNMLDGLDGLAATVGLVICLTLALMAWLTKAPALAMVVTAFAGALAGFLVFNLPPARIYLGDSGSSLIGLMIGAVAIQGSFKAPATASLAVPILVLIIPIFDGVAAVIRRRLTGTAIAAPDRGHIHHSLQLRGWSNRQVLLGVGTLCVITGSAALVSLYFASESVAALAVLAIVGSCVATKLFGYYECLLLFGWPRILWTALQGCLPRQHPIVLALCHRLRQCKSREEVWTILVETAGRLQLRELELQLGWHLGWHARWNSTQPVQELPPWHAAFPLVSARKYLGQLRVVSYQQRKPLLADMLFLIIVAQAVATVCDRLALSAPAGVLSLPPAGVTPSASTAPKNLSA